MSPQFMMARRGVIGLLVGGLLLALGGCGDKFPDYHYKMTIYARGKAFSSVRAVEQEEVSSIVDSSGRTVKTRVAGEAVILELGGRTYYALLSKLDDPDFAAQGGAGVSEAPFENRDEG